MKPINIPNGAWNPLSGVQSPNMIQNFAGINQLDRFSIQESYATDLQNVTSTMFPAMTTRQGFTLLGGAKPEAAKVCGIGVWKGKEIHAIVGGNWYKYDTVNGWVSLHTGLSQTALWTFVNFRGNFNEINLIASNGVDEILKYDGTNVTALANGPVNGDYISTHDNRLYCSVADTLRISALRKAEDWSTVGDSAEIVVETSDGEHISGLVAGPGRLVVFKPHSIHELFGTSPSNYQMKVVSERIGSPAGHTAKMLNGVLYFLGNDGVYRYKGGSLPDKFSMPVVDYIKGINVSWVNRAVAGTDGTRYYLAIPYGSATEPNVVLEYDPNFDIWNVWDYSNPLTSGFVVMDGNIYGGNTAGEIFEFGGTDDAGTAIQWHWTSKPINVTSLAAKNRWYRLWIVADVPTGSSLTVSLSAESDGDTFTEVRTIGAAANVQAEQLMIPVDAVANAKWVRIKLDGTGEATVYEVTRQERILPMGQ